MNEYTTNQPIGSTQSNEPLLDSESFKNEQREQDIKKLVDATFTRVQAEALVDMMQLKAISGGFL